MTRSTKTIVLSSGMLFALWLSSACAVDWAHWGGPHRNGIVADKIAETPSLDVVWEITVGWGYSALALADGHAYTLGHDGEGHETIYCLSEKTGATVWSHKYEAELLPKSHLGGPNAMPTVENGLLYAVSKDAQVFCLNAKDGALIWSKSLVDDFGIDLPIWGISSAPLIAGDRIIFTGPRTLAISKKDGTLTWKTEPVSVPGYATPLRFNAGKQDLLAVLSGKDIAVHKLDDGSRLARASFEAKYDMTAATPVLIKDGQFFISSNMGGRMLRYQDGKLEKVWHSIKMKNTMATSVLIDGHLYGLSGKNGSRHATLTCMKADDGEVKWKEPGMGAGSVIAAGGRLLVLSESGEVVIAEATPEAFTAVARKQILEKTCWTPPTFANGNLFIRNDRGRVACVSLAK
jgi:outer membrane protein assembly factor BamB